MSTDDMYDDFLSPDEAPPDSLLAEGNDTKADLNLLQVKSAENMESILLESSPIEEGTQSERSDALQSDDLSIPSDSLQVAIDELTLDDSDLSVNKPMSTTDPLHESNISTDLTEEVIASSEQKQISSSAMTLDVTEAESETSSPPQSEQKADISTYFTSDKNSNDPFDLLTSAPVEVPTDDNHIRIRTTSESNREEPTPVPFEEIKGAGLKFTQSTKNLSKFFAVESPEDNDDGNGKEFFDTFAAEATVSTDSLPTSTLTGSLPPETPPIPLNVTAPPFEVSPAHRITPQTSVEDKASSIEAAFADSDDPFSASLQMSDSDRRNDAWIPSEMTRQVLIAMVTNPGSAPQLEPSHLTLPGIVMEESLGDPLKDLVNKFMGEAAASKRQVLTVDSVTHDEQGLKELIDAECYRSAVDLTGSLLAACGQGAGMLHQPSLHTPNSMQLWYLRLALLIKLRLYSHAETECLAFGNLDKADLFYEYYTDSYPGRRGSLVSFDMRLLHAELPQYLGKTQESLDRLHYLHAIIAKMLSNLESGLAEDGSIIELSISSRNASQQLWQVRQVRVMYSIGNCLLNIKDYVSSLRVFEKLLVLDCEHEEELHSGIGRIYLQIGDIKTASHHFDMAAEKCADATKKETCCQKALNRGFLALGQNQFSDAYTAFTEAMAISPTNAVAINNAAVCALYEGQLREALSIFEQLVHAEPSTSTMVATPPLDAAILFNLCTLYELESSRAVAKKQALLALVVGHNLGDGFNAACLKMV